MHRRPGNGSMRSTLRVFLCLLWTRFAIECQYLAQQLGAGYCKWDVVSWQSVVISLNGQKSLPKEQPQNYWGESRQREQCQLRSSHVRLWGAPQNGFNVYQVCIYLLGNHYAKQTLRGNSSAAAQIHCKYSTALQLKVNQRNLQGLKYVYKSAILSVT